MTGSSVVVVGAINLDLVVAAPRLPRPGETVVGPRVESFGGGKGANAAVAAARMGARVTLVGAVGDDDTGQRALQDLRAEHIDVSGVSVLDHTPTGVALIVVDEAGENLIAVGLGANAALPADHVRSTLRSNLTGAGCVLVSTEIPDEAVVAAVEAAATAGIRCILNPAPVSEGARQALSFGPIVTPNQHEAAELGGAAAIASITAAPVIVTRGGAGVEVVRQGSSTRLAAPTVEVRDTTGAGDTFNGVLAARLARGDRLEDAVTTAMAAAAHSVGFVGARSGMPTPADLRADADQARHEA